METSSAKDLEFPLIMMNGIDCMQCIIADILKLRACYMSNSDLMTHAKYGDLQDYATALCVSP